MDQGKKQKLMDAAIELVAENGLAACAMAKVAARAGATERLIYLHFGTRDNFLFECYTMVNRQIATLFDELPDPAGEEETTPQETIRRMWMAYFRYLVKGGNNTLFYFEYRNLEKARTVRGDMEAVQNTYFKKFLRTFDRLNASYHVEKKVEIHCFWTYLLDVTSVFASRVIRGQLPDTEEAYESIWKLFSGGLFGLLN